MGKERGPISDMVRIICNAALFSITSIILIVNNLFDQYFVTLQEKVQLQAYTLDVPFYWIMFAAGAGLSAVYSADVSKYLKTGDRGSAEEAAIRALVYSVWFGMIFSVISFVFMVAVFGIFAERDVAIQAGEYLLPLHIFFFVISLNSVLGGLLKAEGKHRAYVAALLLMLLCNYLFDTLFVKTLGLGLLGNGCGTVCAAAVSLLFELSFYLRGKTVVKLKMGNYSWSREAARSAFYKIRTFLIRHITKDLAELAVRFTIYLAYSLTYGIPMLYSALIATIGLGAGTYLSSEYEKLFVAGDREGVKKLFVISTVTVMSVTFLLAFIVYFSTDILASPFESKSTYENMMVMKWTMGVLAFTAPFVGLRAMANAVAAPVGRFTNATAMLIVWASFKVIAVIYAADFGYDYIIYVILAERILAAFASLILTFWHLRYNYRRHVVSAQTVRS